MKITVSQLRKIIAEEVKRATLNEIAATPNKLPVRLVKAFLNDIGMDLSSSPFIWNKNTGTLLLQHDEAEPGLPNVYSKYVWTGDGWDEEYSEDGIGFDAMGNEIPEEKPAMKPSKGLRRR